MPAPSTIRDVFGHFQNLNLLVLVQDLRDGRTARHAWFSGSEWCPVAHGLPAGQQLRALAALGQSADLSKGCEYAAQHLGADSDAVRRFVRSWDEETFNDVWLLRQLEEIWEERLEDAEAVQEVLQGAPECRANLPAFA
jgi:hypothetical protein